MCLARGAWRGWLAVRCKRVGGAQRGARLFVRRCRGALRHLQAARRVMPLSVARGAWREFAAVSSPSLLGHLGFRKAFRWVFAELCVLRLLAVQFVFQDGLVKVLPLGTFLPREKHRSFSIVAQAPEPLKQNTILKTKSSLLGALCVDF